MFKLITFAVILAVSTANEEILEKILDRLDQQQKQIESLQHVITSQSKQRIVDAVASRKTTPETPIYFSASISAGVDLATDGIVVYDDTILNVGDLYASDGRFTCPVGGYYYFHVSVKSDALRVAQANIVRDDGSATTVVASAMSVDGYDHASNGVYIECPAGNTVYVVGGTSAGRLYGETGLRYNVFSGGLLWVIS